MPVVETLHHARLKAVFALTTIVAPHASFLGQVRAIFGKVQDGRRVEMGAHPEDASTGLAEPIERRSGSVIIVPWRVGE